MSDKTLQSQGESLSRVFNGADQQQEANTEKRSAVTKAELEQLKSRRDKPQPTLTLQPDGSTVKAVNQRIAQHREQRIAYIERRLEARQDMAKNDFNKTQQEQDMKERDR